MKTFLSKLLHTARPTDAKIDLLKNQYGLNDEQVEQVIQADPTEKDYVAWIANQIKKKLLRLPEDKAKIRTQLEQFTKLKRSPRFTGEKDIQRYTPAKLFETVSQVEKEPTQLSEKEQNRTVMEKGGPGAEIVYKGSDGVCYKVTTPEMAVLLGSNTNWCTNSGAAAQYLKEGPLWIFYVDGRPYMQAHVPTRSLMDTQDNTLLNEDSSWSPEVEDAVAILDNKIPQGQEGWSVDLAAALSTVEDRETRGLVAKVPELAKEFLGEGADEYRDLLDAIGEGERLDPHQIRMAIEKPLFGFLYMAKTGQPLSGFLESILSNDRVDSELLSYAKLVGHRTPEIEKKLLSGGDGAASLMNGYARYVIHDRWPEAEQFIAKNSWTAFSYATQFLYSRWPQGEEAIKKVPDLWHKYLRAFPEAQSSEDSKVLKVAIENLRWSEKNYSGLTDMLFNLGEDEVSLDVLGGSVVTVHSKFKGSGSARSNASYSMAKGEFRDPRSTYNFGSTWQNFRDTIMPHLTRAKLEANYANFLGSRTGKIVTVTIEGEFIPKSWLEGMLREFYEYKMREGGRRTGSTLLKKAP
jgi:hypothetical protein